MTPQEIIEQQSQVIAAQQVFIKTLQDHIAFYMGSYSAAAARSAWTVVNKGKD